MRTDRLAITELAASLSVQQQARFTQRGVIGCVVLSLYLARPLLSTIERLTYAYSSRDWGTFSFQGSILLIVLVGGFTIWSGAVTAEVLHCDTQRFQVARKPKFRRWTRRWYSATSVRDLRFGVVRQTQYEVVKGLVCEHDLVTTYLFEHLTAVEADRILKACERLNISVKHDQAMPMLADIDRRGWLINPWRPDPPANHPTE